MKIFFSSPKTYNRRRLLLRKAFEKYDPIHLLEDITGWKWNRDLIIEHKNLGLKAEFEGLNKIKIDFRKSWKYCTISTIHELAHLFLRNSHWDKNKSLESVFKTYGYKKFGEYNYSFQYALEQTFAFLLQAACEEKIGFFRKLNWDLWKADLKAHHVFNLAKVFWKSWKDYLTHKDSYLDMEDWIIGTLFKLRQKLANLNLNF